MSGWVAMVFAAAAAAGIFFWKRRTPLRRSVAETLIHFGEALSLAHRHFKQVPIPTLSGDYFGFRISIEGSHKKQQGKRSGFRFLATIELPKNFKGRVFVQSEQRKTSLKPIAELKLVSTSLEPFNQRFLLLADDERMGLAAFQPYLCEKILALTESNWQMDVHDRAAHLELWQEILNSASLAELFKVIFESLNALLVAGG